MNDVTQTIWYDRAASDKVAASAFLRPWLLDPTSLTALLKRVAKEKFSLQVLNEVKGLPFQNEIDLLEVDSSATFHIREVLLKCDSEAGVFARTIIPEVTSADENTWLLRLGEQPLGELLFQDPRIMRGPFQIAKIESHHKLFEHVLQNVVFDVQCLWGRRSVFYIDHKPILVSEIFLPHVPEYPRETSELEI